MKRSFTITYKDVEKLQKTVKTIEKTNHLGENYATFEYFLTVNNQPLDLVAQYCNQYDYETWEEYNIDYRCGCEDSAIDNLDFESAFLRSIDSDKKTYYLNHIEEYDDDFEEYKQKTREMIDYSIDDDILSKEYAKAMDEIANNMRKTYLHGDYRDDGVIRAIQKHLDKVDIEFDYDDETGNVTITQERDSDYMSKDYFLNSCKRSIIYDIQDKREKAQKRREEREAEAIRKQEYEVWTINKKKELILSTM